MARGRAWLALGLALAGLNLALSFHNLWPTPWITARWELSVEVAALVLVLALLREWGHGPSPRLVHGLALVALLFTVGRYLEVTAPALYGRRINVYWDAQHLPRVTAMLVDGLAPWQIWLLGAGILALVATLYLLLRALLRLLLAGLAQPAPRRASLLLGAALVALYAGGHLHPRIHTLQWFSLPVSATYAQQAGFVYQALAGQPTLEVDAPPLPDSSLARLGGADLLILFFESYGATTLDRPELAQALAEPRRRLAAAVEETGRTVLSARVRSPTFGGASWLAHASFLSGIEVRGNQRYQQLLTTGRETLVHRFAGRGYRTVGVMPGLRRAWPEGAFYGYDRIHDAASLDYRGPAFGWWRIPDQYALARFDALERGRREDQPVMAVMSSITSHAPFHPVPPCQRDWQAVLGPDAYGMQGGGGRAEGRPGGGMREDYLAAIEYMLTCLAGYLRHRAGDDLVLVVIGDHQPPARLTGPAAPWEVPVHVIARNRSLMDALASEGFVAGLEPAPDGIGAMHELAAMLLRAWDGDPAIAAAATAPADPDAGPSLEPGVDVAGPGGRGQRLGEAAHLPR